MRLGPTASGPNAHTLRAVATGHLFAGIHACSDVCKRVQACHHTPYATVSHPPQEVEADCVRPERAHPSRCCHGPPGVNIPGCLVM